MISWPRWRETGGDPDKFLKYDYAETKDLCKQFLTLVSGLLVFSLTLSDKVVGFSTASTAAKVTLVAAWIAMLSSIISCGLGLTTITLAAGDAAYGGTDYQRYAARAFDAIVIAGGCFILGLSLLVVAAVLSLSSHATGSGG